MLYLFIIILCLKYRRVQSMKKKLLIMTLAAVMAFSQVATATEITQIDAVQADGEDTEETTLELDQSDIKLTDTKPSRVIMVTDSSVTAEKSFTYKSNDDNIVSVEKVASNDMVKVTAKNYGSATITITSADGKKEATCQVNVCCTDFTVDDVNLLVGSDPLEIVPKFKEGFTYSVDKIVFRTDNEKIIKISNGNKLEAISSGTANVTATILDDDNYGEKITKTFQVTVKSPVTGIEVSEDKISLIPGKTYQLKPVVLPADATDTSVSYLTDDETVAIVDDNGLIKAVSTGTANITIKANDGSKVTKKVTVSVTQPVTEIAPEKTIYETFLGINFKIPAPAVKPDNASDKNVAYASSDEKIVKVDDKGMVEAIGAGSAVITITAKDGSDVKAEITVNVKGQIDALTASKDSVSVEEGTDSTVAFTTSVSANDLYTDLLSAQAKDSSNVGSIKVTKADKDNKDGNTVLSFKALKAGETDITISSKNPTQKDVSVVIHVIVKAKAPAAQPAEKPKDEKKQETQDNTKVTHDNITYEIVDPDKATCRIVTGKCSGSVKIPSAVEINGKTYMVTEIASSAFTGSKITKVTIPASITKIGNAAFKNCKKLKTVTIGKNVTQIGNEAFRGTSVAKITIPSKVKKIGKKAFYGCKKLKTVTIKSSRLKSVGNSAFKSIAKKSTIKCPKAKKTKYKNMLKNKYSSKYTKLK